MSIAKRIVLPLVALSFLALSACSSDSESTASGALPNNPTKAQYIEAANAICSEPLESPSDLVVEQGYYERMKPLIDLWDQRIDKLDKLNKPDADESYLSTAYAEMRDASAKLRAGYKAFDDGKPDSESVSQAEGYFGDDNAIARYGAEQCETIAVGRTEGKFTSSL